nr:hypothetical protein [Halobaculum salinum]
MFPPVAGGAADAAGPGDEEGTGGDADAADGGTATGEGVPAGGESGDAEWVEAYRGISRRLAVRYLRNLGGETDRPDEEATEVVGDGWRATLETETVSPAGSITLTEVTVRFTGESATLEELVPAFGRKAMRAGG